MAHVSFRIVYEIHSYRQFFPFLGSGVLNLLAIGCLVTKIHVHMDSKTEAAVEKKVLKFIFWLHVFK